MGLAGEHDLTPEAVALRDYMSELSEEAYCAAWLQDLEYALWSAIDRGPFEYGRLQLSAEHIERLRALSDACGGWIRFDDDLGEVFVPLEEWRRRFTKRAGEQWV